MPRRVRVFRYPRPTIACDTVALTDFARTGWPANSCDGNPNPATGGHALIPITGCRGNQSSRPPLPYADPLRLAVYVFATFTHNPKLRNPPYAPSSTIVRVRLRIPEFRSRTGCSVVVDPQQVARRFPVCRVWCVGSSVTGCRQHQVVRPCPQRRSIGARTVRRAPRSGTIRQESSLLEQTAAPGSLARSAQR